MGGAEEVVDGLDGVECRDGDFEEDCVPVAHGSVPQTGEFHRFEVFAVEGFGGYESGFVVDMGAEVIFVSVGVLYVAYEVDRVEMGCLFHHLDVLRVVIVNLVAFENLWRGRAVGVVGYIRASTGFAFVFNHAAHAEGSVKFSFDIEREFGVFHRFQFGVAKVERVVQEMNHLAEIVDGVGAAVELLEVAYNFVVDLNEVTGYDFFISYRVGTLALGGDVVDVFEEDD